MKTNQPISNKFSWASKVILVLLNLAKKLQNIGKINQECLIGGVLVTT